MTRETKLLEHLRNNPRNVRPDELFDVLRAEGVEVRQHGSHVGLARGGARMTLALPHDGGHLKAPYVVEALKTFGLADAAEPLEEARRRHEDVAVWRDETDGFFAAVPALPGCLTHGETRAEALANLEDAKACWLALGEPGP